MSKKEQFLAFVLVGATAQDISTDNNDCPLILRLASQIPEERIPDNVTNAAKVFLAFCNGVCKRPAWVDGGGEGGGLRAEGGKLKGDLPQRIAKSAKKRP